MSNRQISSKRKSSIRIGSETSATRAKILDEVERLMISEGYASVTSRRVAKELDIKPSLVHYYFPTTDDLLLAVWLRSIETQRFHEEAEAINSLESLWRTYYSKSRNALALEFMALANHRKVIRDQIALHTHNIRGSRSELLSKLSDLSRLPDGCGPDGLSVVLIAVARTLVMEEGLGITRGHDEAISIVKSLLDMLEP
jgi:AcrR family transcriptional regulator